jgi:hypothetical protein
MQRVPATTTSNNNRGMKEGDQRDAVSEQRVIAHKNNTALRCARVGGGEGLPKVVTRVGNGLFMGLLRRFQHLA